MEDIKISVIVPLYNAEKYIKKCITSIQEQTYQNIEIVVVDDGSNDNSVEIVQDLMKADNRIRLYKKENGGPASAKNMGLKHAHGDYVIFVDSDDWIDIALISEVVKRIKTSKASIVYYNYVMENEKGRLLSTSCFEKFIEVPIERIIELNITGQFPCGATNKAIRRDIIEISGAKFTESLRQGEEFEYTIKTILEKPKIDFVTKKVYYHYLQRKGSQSRKLDLNFKKNIELIASILKEKNLYEKYYEQYKTKIITYLSIEIYRCCIGRGIMSAKNEADKICKSYKERYGIEEFVLTDDTKRTKVTFFFIRKNKILQLVLIFKIFILYKTIIQKPI